MEARQNRTILSAGLLVNALLRTLPEVNVYPVMAPEEGSFPPWCTAVPTWPPIR